MRVIQAETKSWQNGLIQKVSKCSTHAFNIDISLLIRLVRLTREKRQMGETIRFGVSIHIRDLSETLTEHQHACHNRIISVLHVHLDAHACLEGMVMRGPANEVKRIADELFGIKGVKHGKLVMTSSGDGLR